MSTSRHAADGTPDPRARVETLREHLEDSMRRHQRPSNIPSDPWCNHCDYPWPCPDFRAATKMVAILDQAQTCAEWPSLDRTAWRLVPDPKQVAALSKAMGWDEKGGDA